MSLYAWLMLKEGLDIVSITTPADTHYEMAMAAMKAGIHVVCEKPMASILMSRPSLMDSSARKLWMPFDPQDEKTNGFSLLEIQYLPCEDAAPSHCG